MFREGKRNVKSSSTLLEQMASGSSTIFIFRKALTGSQNGEVEIRKHNENDSILINRIDIANDIQAPIRGNVESDHNMARYKIEVNFQ